MQNTDAGHAARALREFRERVYRHPDFPDLTLAQMSKECGFVNEDGNGIASAYQYNEREFTGKYFSKDKVNMFKIPLIRRGIPETEIYSVLAGVPNLSLDRPVEVGFTSSRRVPVISRDTALRISRGELLLDFVSNPTAIQKLENDGSIKGWMDFGKVGDQTAILEAFDGLGTEIVVDFSDKTLIEDKQYLILQGGMPSYVTFKEGFLEMEEGAPRTAPIAYNEHAHVVLGRVVWICQPL